MSLNPSQKGNPIKDSSFLLTNSLPNNLTILICALKAKALRNVEQEYPNNLGEN